MKDCEGWLEGCNKDRAIEISSRSQPGHHSLRQGLSYPIAKVLQSDEGASAVIGSKMVRAAMCSEVEGSNKIMLPWSLPVCPVSGLSWSPARAQLTERDIAIPHKTCGLYMFICRESRHLSSIENIPHNRGVAGIVADREPSRSSFAGVVGNDP